MIITDEKIYNAQILIVDDKPSNVQLLEFSLKQAGYSKIFKTTDSRKAAELYKQIRPDLVLLDINMPHLDGFQVLQQLKEIERGYYAPVMVLTARSDQETRVRALDEGARDFLTKPFDQLEIRIRIKNMLELRLLNEFARLQNKILEEKIRKRTEDLETKNQDLKDFVYIASHDLQEPLRRIITFGDLLKKTIFPLEEKSLDYLDRMQKSSQRMKALIEDLLLFCKITHRENQFNETDLEQVVREVLADLEIPIEQSKAKIIVRKLPTLNSDPVQFRLLFQNLISNAIKYRKLSVPPVVTLDSRLLENRKWEITVEDNGIGFNAEYRDRIFRPFERLHGKDEFSGNGMGLTICRNIVSRHGGTIIAESQPGKGTKFIVTLPSQLSEIPVSAAG